MKVALFSDS